MIVRTLTATILAATAICPAIAADAQVYYRGTSHIVLEPPATPSTQPAAELATHGPISIVLPEVRGLTTGTALSFDLSGGGTSGASYRLKAPIPGLLADPSTGQVFGTPTGSVGTPYVLGVEATNVSGTVLAATPDLAKVLRAPLAIASGPSDLSLEEGFPLPTTGLAALSAGGDPSALTWTLTGAPSWLEIAGNGTTGANLRIKTGSKSETFAKADVSLVASDGEGRRSAPDVFSLEVARNILSKVLSGSISANAVFGWSVDIDGNTAVVGSPWTNASAGVVYVFVKSGTDWVQQGSAIVPTGLASGDQFGTSVAVSGDTLVVGSPNAATSGVDGAGAVHVFTRTGTTWTQKQRIAATSTNVSFGKFVDIDADTLVVGTDTFTASRSGGPAAVFAYLRSGGTFAMQGGRLMPSSTPGAIVSVAVSGNTIAMGDINATVAGKTTAGVAYVLTRSGTTWTLQSTLTASDPVADDRFGQSVAISGGTIVVGSIYADLPSKANTGAAYVFTGSGASWSQTQKLVATDGKAGDAFGASVSIDGGLILVGAEAALSPANQRTGAAYLFASGTGGWTQERRLLPKDGAANDYFGKAVSVKGGNVVVGSYSSDPNAISSAGSAYMATVR